MRSIVNQDWRGAVVRRLLLLVGACLLLGFITGEYAWVLACGLAIHLGWTLSQLLRLHKWLREHKPDEPPPDGYGLWGEVFDSIYHLQRRNQKARGRLQAVIDRVQESTAALRDAVIMLDSEGNLEWWNRAAEQLLGLKTPQDSGQAITNLVRHPRFKEYFEAGQYQEALEIPSPINDRQRLQLQITRYGNNEHLMFVRDVTRLHQLEQMRKDFVANVSHELRTPLTVIRVASDMAMAEDSPPRVARALQRIQRAGRDMEAVIDAFLILAREAEVEPQSEDFDVADIVMDEAENARALLLNKPVDLEVTLHARPRLHAPPRVFQVVVSNLLRNACSYTDRGRIDVILDPDRVIVRDTGIGMSAESMVRVFEPFYRADPSRPQGSGLGLSIVSRLCDRFGWKIELDSELGRGTTATIRFVP